MVSQFESLGLLPEFVQAVEQLGFEQPTPIQKQAIPALLAGRNVMGQAQTGTGKTAAFVLPMLQKIQLGEGIVQALVLAPTRELAIQVAEATNRLAQTTSARVMAVYGGQAYRVQTRQLEEGVDIVVGTPGRLLDLIRRRLLDLSQVCYLVLDEADEMLEMGFIEDVETILGKVPDDRQISLFSATLPSAVRKLADRYLGDSHQISIDPTRPTVAETEQRFCRVREDKKLAVLIRLLESEEVTSALIFARTKVRTQELSDALNRRGIPAEALHGDLNQDRRELVLNRFRRHSITLLVATDVAARGLDIEAVSHVFNYDAPADAEDYVHRIGRTGRAGRKGIAVTFFTPGERSRLNQIEAFTRQPIVECHIPTPDEIQTLRDERFLEQLSERLAKGKLVGERALIGRLQENNFDMMEIAAAAIQMARAGESELPLEELSDPSTTNRSVRRHTLETTAWEAPVRGKKKPGNSQRERQSVSYSSGDSYRPSDSYRSGDANRQSRRNKGQREQGMVRLKMNLGNAQGLHPSDVVGAIASEVGIPGKAIGEIDIRRDYTLVDVSEQHVRRVLQESNGQYFLHGKPVLLTLAS